MRQHRELVCEIVVGAGCGGKLQLLPWRVAPTGSHPRSRPKKLKVSDALDYLDKVKNQFGQQLEDFSTFSKSFDALFRFRLRVEGLGFSSSSASPLMRSSGLGVRVTV